MYYYSNLCIDNKNKKKNGPSHALKNNHNSDRYSYRQKCAIINVYVRQV